MLPSCFGDSWEHSELKDTTGTRAGADLLARMGQAISMRHMT